MGTYHIEHFDPEAIALSGQCFRMHILAPGRVEVIHRGRRVEIAVLGEDAFAFSCSDAEFENVWRHFFDLETDYRPFLEAIDKTDHYLTCAAEAGRGLRILRQDPWEVLISFILSQRKSIPAIRDNVEKLCRRFGEPLAEYGPDVFAFPTPQALAGASMEELSACSLGYRAPYVRAAAISVAAGQTDLPALSGLDDEALLQSLLSLYGVGVKVARCVMLFGYHRLCAAPVDVWIGRVIDQEYGGVSPFARYAGFCGVIQQYMFYQRITAKRPEKPAAQKNLPSGASHAIHL